MRAMKWQRLRSRLLKPPAPVIFQFLKGIFRIGTVAVPLGKGRNLLRERGDQHSVFVDDDLLV